MAGKTTAKLYDDQQTLRVKETQGSYSVLVRVPKHVSKFV